MKSAWGLTGVMGLLAAALAIGASLVYPWPEPIETGGQTNQKIFADLDVNQVRTLAIVAFDQDNRKFESIQLKKVKDSWTIPSSGDYPAGNVARVAAIFDLLAESLILEAKSSDESTHALYGVIDSDVVQDAKNQTGIGTKISLADSNNRPLAQLIVGKQVGDNPAQRFVRVVGQPNVYVIDVPASLVSTKVSDWVDHNLLDLQASTGGTGLQVARLQIDHYVIEGDSVAAANAKKYNFRAVLDFKNQTSPLTLYQPTAEGPLGQAITDRKLKPAGVEALGTDLLQIPFTAVGKKPDAAAQSLRAGMNENADLAPLADAGFRKSAESPPAIESKNGQLAVSTSEGIDWTLNFGAVAPASDPTQTQINYYLLITAAVSEAAFPLPPEPADPANEDQKRDHERALKRREDSLNACRTRVQQYNERHAPWLYLIGEDALLALRPDEAKLIQ